MFDDIRLLPSAVEAERNLLGAILLFRDTQHEIIPMLTDACFYDAKTNKIYKAIKELYDNSKAVDLITVADQLHKNDDLHDIGGAYELTELTRSVGSSSSAVTWAFILLEKSIRREMIQINEKYHSSAYDESLDTLTLLDDLQKDCLQLGNVSASHAISSVRQLASKVIKESIDAKNNPDILLGITTGFRTLNEITNGWKHPDLIIIAGRPAMGKTSFAVQCAINAAINSYPVGIFSLEMSKEQITRRMIASLMDITTHDIEAGKIDTEILESAQNKINQLEIYINDKPALTALEIRNSARKMVKDYGCRLLLIDYLQLIAGSNKRQNREAEVSEISRSLKAVAKELQVPVIALSQLSRKCEERGDKRPMLSDLRESGAIEQDADMVLFLFRPEYYDIKEDSEGNSTAGIAEVIIAKHRNGAIGTVELTFIDKYTKFTEPEYDLSF